MATNKAVRIAPPAPTSNRRPPHAPMRPRSWRHALVRDADDGNIYLGSRAAAERTMASVGEFLERQLRLKVNTEALRHLYGMGSPLI